MWLRCAYFGRSFAERAFRARVSPPRGPLVIRLTREIRARPRCRNGRTTFTRRNWPSKRNATTVSRYSSFRRYGGGGPRAGGRGTEGEGGNLAGSSDAEQPIYVPFASRALRVNGPSFPPPRLRSRVTRQRGASPRSGLPSSRRSPRPRDSPGKRPLSRRAIFANTLRRNPPPRRRVILPDAEAAARASHLSKSARAEPRDSGPPIVTAYSSWPAAAFLCDGAGRDIDSCHSRRSIRRGPPARSLSPIRPSVRPSVRRRPWLRIQGETTNVHEDLMRFPFRFSRRSRCPDRGNDAMRPRVARRAFPQVLRLDRLSSSPPSLSADKATGPFFSRGITHDGRS